MRKEASEPDLKWINRDFQKQKVYSRPNVRGGAGRDTGRRGKAGEGKEGRKGEKGGRGGQEVGEVGFTFSL